MTAQRAQISTKLDKIGVKRFSRAEMAVFGVSEEKRNVYQLRIFCSDNEVAGLQERLGKLLTGAL